MTTSAPILTTPIVALRPATQDDAAAVRRVASLDSATVPVGPLLLGIIDGEVSAAVSLTTGAVVADPFKPTANVVELLVLRAARLRDAGRSQGLVQRAREGLPTRRRHARAFTSA
ncbi:MAG: hypothetical protein JWO02_4521 [Solirubrobacterales bacterium]|nr:hypothetical protein [Solirubrobacterales bacterium]